MDAAIVLAALILNPIARKRRARLDVEALSEETSSLSTHGEVNSAELTSANADSRLLPLTEPKDSEPGTVNAITEEPRTLSEKSR